MAKESTETHFQGEAIYSDVPAGKPARGQQLGPGKWCLHSRSLVPYAKVDCGAVGARNVTWGEIYVIPPGRFGRVLNSSFHDGDIIFAETGGDTAPPRPARITIKAPIVIDPKTSFRRTPWVDTRLVRRAYLAVHPLSPTESNVTYTVLYQAPTQGGPISTTGAGSKNGGVVTMNRAIVGPLEEWSLGFASGEYLDTAGNTAPELRPMAFLDRLRVEVSEAVATAIGFAPDTDAFYVLEY